MPRTTQTVTALKPSRARKPKAPEATRIKAAPPPVETAPLPAPAGKLGVLVGLLRREEGATLADLQAATGWQAHSVRGAIAGSLKKKLALPVSSTKVEGGPRTYRIAS